MAVKSQIDLDHLRRLSGEGLNLTEISNEIGVSRNTISRRANSLGIEVDRFAKSKKMCREVVQGMKLEDAVEHLLVFIERQFESQRLDRLAQIMIAGKFTSSEGKLLVELSTGKFRTRDNLLNFLCVGKSVDEEPEIKIVDVFICKIRKKLRSLGWPVEIQTVWGKGCILSRLEPDFRFPWETDG